MVFIAAAFCLATITYLIIILFAFQQSSIIKAGRVVRDWANCQADRLPASLAHRSRARDLECSYAVCPSCLVQKVASAAECHNYLVSKQSVSQSVKRASWTCRLPYWRCRCRGSCSDRANQSITFWDQHLLQSTGWYPVSFARARSYQDTKMPWYPFPLAKEARNWSATEWTFQTGSSSTLVSLKSQWSCSGCCCGCGRWIDWLPETVSRHCLAGLLLFMILIYGSRAKAHAALSSSQCTCW